MTARRDGKKLGRMLRVRSLQLDLARAEQAAAAERASSAAALAARIESLRQDVAPRQGTEQGLSLFAAAHYRDRLAKSQVDAQRRVTAAHQLLDQARDAANAAKRDHGAVEKLIERELGAQAAAARKALEDAPHPTRALARSLLKSG
jgi:capsule polysaccharide export protein KpsE/RkpR